MKQVLTPSVCIYLHIFFVLLNILGLDLGKNPNQHPHPWNLGNEHKSNTIDLPKAVDLKDTVNLNLKL